MTASTLMRRILTTLMLILASAGVQRACAQEETYKFDIGIGAGLSGYLGDANRTNPLASPGFAAQASFRYLINTRWAIRGLFTTASISGNTAKMTEVLPGGAQYAFRSQLFDLGARAEFNFLPYGIGETYKRLRRISPYLAAGLGVTMSNAGGGHLYAGLSLPLAFGVKFKLRPRLNLAAEFAMVKTFSDKMDSPQLTDLYLVKTSFLKDTDWQSHILISISYEFGKRCETCHYVD